MVEKLKLVPARRFEPRVGKTLVCFQAFSHEAPDVFCALVGSERQRSVRPRLGMQWCFGCPTSEAFHEGDAIYRRDGVALEAELEGDALVHERGWLGLVRGGRLWWFCPTCFLAHEPRTAREYLKRGTSRELLAMMTRGLAYCEGRFQTLSENLSVAPGGKPEAAEFFVSVLGEARP